MAISFITGTSTNGNASSYTFAHNITGTDHGIIFVGVGLRTTTSTGITVTYAGTNLTKLTTMDDSGANDRNELWYLLNPASGNNNVVVTLAAASKAAVGAITYNGVRQDNTFGASGTSNAANTTPNITLTTTYPNSWILNTMSGRTPTTFTGGGSNTVRFSDASTGGAGSSNVMEVGADLTTTTTGSYNVSGTLGATVSYVYFAQEFLPSNTNSQATIF